MINIDILICIVGPSTTNTHLNTHQSPQVVPLSKSTSHVIPIQINSAHAPPTLRQIVRPEHPPTNGYWNNPMQPTFINNQPRPCPTVNPIVVTNMNTTQVPTGYHQSNMATNNFFVPTQECRGPLLVDNNTTTCTPSIVTTLENVKPPTMLVENRCQGGSIRPTCVLRPSYNQHINGSRPTLITNNSCHHQQQQNHPCQIGQITGPQQGHIGPPQAHLNEVVINQVNLTTNHMSRPPQRPPQVWNPTQCGWQQQAPLATHTRPHGPPLTWRPNHNQGTLPNPNWMHAANSTTTSTPNIIGTQGMVQPPMPNLPHVQVGPPNTSFQQVQMLRPMQAHATPTF